VTRVLAIMGSGETSPTMVRTHRGLFEALGEPAPAVLLDTPFGFQENADDIAARAVAYFADSIGRTIDVARFRDATRDDPIDRERALERLRAARFVFAGPGSPSYALRQWQDSPVPELLRDKLRTDGCICFASAAALTLGVVTVPVYEIYKVGADPVWLEGLDLLAETGLRAAVIPHYDNAEGGNHDTRYCYLGERRLRVLENQLPDDAFVLGVDEHTALVLDLDAGSATVSGRGGVTIRRGADQRVLATGTTVGIADLAAAGDAAAVAPLEAGAPIERTAGPASSPLLETAAELETSFTAALDAGDLHAAAGAVLALDDAITAWSADTLQSDEPDQARGLLRSMVLRLGEAAAALSTRAGRVGPLVEELLAARAAARADGRYEQADGIRDRLGALGVDVRDTGEGVTWHLLS
jgi:hypothetical protein